MARDFVLLRGARFLQSSLGRGHLEVYPLAMAKDQNKKRTAKTNKPKLSPKERKQKKQDKKEDKKKAK
jgi:hypothetical protein